MSKRALMTVLSVGTLYALAWMEPAREPQPSEVAETPRSVATDVTRSKQLSVIVPPRAAGATTIAQTDQPQHVRAAARGAATPAARTHAAIVERTAPARRLAPAAPAGGDSEQYALDQRFAVERDDRRWTEEANEYLAGALADAKLGDDHIASVDCRTTLCRVELRFASLDEAQKLYELRHPDYEMRYFADGARYTVYVAREGALLGQVVDPLDVRK